GRCLPFYSFFLFFFFSSLLPPRSTLFPYTTLFRSIRVDATRIPDVLQALSRNRYITVLNLKASAVDTAEQAALGFFYGQNVPVRSEEHTSELQSRENLVCRLLLEKKKEKEYMD